MTDQQDNYQHPMQARDIADGVKLAIKELAKEEPETLRAFIMAIWEHTINSASQWIGKRFLTLIATVLLSIAFWLIGTKGWGK